MKLPRLAAVAAGVLLVLLWAGCGDVFRPVANPISTPGGDPQNLHLAMVVNQGVPLPDGNCFEGTPPPCAGAATEIDVSGDVALTTVVVGRNPVFAAYASGFLTAYVLNRDSDTVSAFSNALITTTTTTSPTVTSGALLAGAAPVFALPVTVSPPVVTSATPYLYVADSGTNTVSALSQVSNSVAADIPVGAAPVSLAASTDGRYVYAVNRDSNTVSVISTAGNAVQTTIPVGTTPVWALTNPNGTAIYVLNQGSASISIIDPTNNVVTGTLALPAGGSANFMLFDQKLQRVYVTNPSANSISVFDVSQATPQKLADVAVGSMPLAVAVGTGGTKAYVVNSGETTGCSGEANMGRVTVINTTSNKAVACVTVGKTPAWIAASADGSKVYVPHRDRTLTASNGQTSVAIAAGTSVIATSTDTVAANVPAPFADKSCTTEDVNTPPTTNCVRMAPMFVVTSQ